MRQIKFRGETLGGRIVYGFFCCTEVEDVTLPCIIVEEGDYRQVKPDSVAQLIGIDASGREVYEGDTVIDQHGIEYTAYLVGIADGETEFIRLDDEIETASLEFKVKEEQCT